MSNFLHISLILHGEYLLVEKILPLVLQFILKRSTISHSAKYVGYILQILLRFANFLYRRKIDENYWNKQWQFEWFSY
jgi:hypothetical protein